MNETIEKGKQVFKGEPEILTLTQQADFPTDTVTDPFAGGEAPHKSNRIVNYRRLQNWENYFLDSAICSVAVATGISQETLKTLGNEKTFNALELFSAITGDMFAVLYSSEKYCDSGMTHDFFLPKMVKKAYAAIGYDCIYISNAQIKKDPRATLNAIKKSVDNGIPVMAWGISNVPEIGDMPEGCLIGGYEGDLLHVNVYPGPERMKVDEDGYCPVPDGLDGTNGLFFLGEPIEKPDMREIYENAIANIPYFLNAQPANGFVFGKEAFEKWADTLMEDERFEGKTDEEIGGICWMIHCAPYCNLCTSAANKFILAAAEFYNIPIAKKLLPLYQRFFQLRQDIWNTQDGFFPPSDKFRTHDFREKLAGILRDMGNVCDDILKVFIENKI